MNKKIEISFNKLLLIAFSVLAVVAGVSYAQSTTRSGSAIIGRIDYVEVAVPSFFPDLSDAVCTSGSGLFEDIPDMEKTFTQGGFVANEIVVSFSGLVRQSNNPAAPIILLIDGVVQPGMGQQGLLSNPDPDTISTSNVNWNFVSAPVSPGSHTVKLQWQGPITGDSCMFSRSMVIHHR